MPEHNPLIASEECGDPTATAVGLEFELNPRRISAVRGLIEFVASSLEWMLPENALFSFFCDIHIARKICPAIFASAIVIDSHSLGLIGSHHVHKRGVYAADNVRRGEFFDHLENIGIIAVWK